MSNSFFSIDGKPLYNRSKHYAHELHSENEIQSFQTALEDKVIKKEAQVAEPIVFVKWSEEGNMAFLREYSSMGGFSYYEDVFISFSKQYCIRLNTINESLIVNEIDPIENSFKEEETIRLLNSYTTIKFPLIINTGINQRINKFLFPRWYPIL